MNARGEVERSLSKGTKNIGVMTFWSGLKDVRIARALWRQGLHIAGVEDAVGKDPKPEALLNASVQRAMRAQGRGGDRIRIELKSKGQRAVYRVKMPRPQDDQAHDIEEATISLDCYVPGAMPVVEVRDGVGPDADRERICDAVVETFGELRDYVYTEEVSAGLVAIVDYLGGITLRTGVYFIATDNGEKLRAVRKFVESSTSARFTCWNINGDDDNALEARRDAKEAMINRLQEVIAEVKDFTETIAVEDAETRSVNAKVRRFRELDALVDLWSDVLGDYRDALRVAIAEAKQVLLGAYLGTAEDDSTDAPTTNETNTDNQTTEAA